MHRLRLARRIQRKRRRGVAATELAVCMPVLVLIVLATIEANAMIFLQQSLSIAAYEGTRVAIVPGAESKNVQYQVEMILADRGVTSGTVTVSPSDIAGAAEGTWLAVEASAPFKENAMTGGWLFGQRLLTARVEMVKEQ